VAPGAQQEGAGAQQVGAGAQQVGAGAQQVRGAQQLPQLLPQLWQPVLQHFCLQHFCLQHFCLQQLRAWASEPLMARLKTATTTAANVNSLRVIVSSP
jgi:hypothetical protein